MNHVSFFEITSQDKAFFESTFSSPEITCSYNPDVVTTAACDPQTTILSVFVHSQVTQDIIDSLPNLKMICCRATGFNNIDLEAAERRGIIVTNVPSYGEHSVAEHTFALILALAKNLFKHNTLEHPLSNPEVLTGIDLYGKTLGVLGTGKIGSSVIAIATSFGMNVLCYDLFPNTHLVDKYNCKYVDLDTLLIQSDIITLHLPYTKHNHHIIDRLALSKMKKGARIINTARGELIDTHALIEALESDHLSGAGLDVFEGEQFMHVDKEICLLNTGTAECDLQAMVALSVLKQLPQVVITPHNAYNTVEAIARINAVTTENITHFIKGAPQNKIIAPIPEMGMFIVARHHESEWNAKGLWTGSRDTHLTERGFAGSAQMGLLISDIKIDQSFASTQLRSLETLSGMLGAMQQFSVPLTRSSALNERDYGDYTGKNKLEMKELLGDEAFEHLHRDWDYPVPNGETLKVVYERVVPYFLSHILPQLQAGKNVLLVSHGNAIRSLMKYLEQISDEGVSDIEMLFGSVLIYTLDTEGHMQSKIVRTLPDAHSPLK